MHPERLPMNAEGTAEGGPSPTTFSSLLFGPDPTLPVEQDRSAACFPDLHLDQLVEEMIASRPEYHLAPIFYTPLTTEAAVRYRQDVLRALETSAMRAAVRDFVAQFRVVETWRTESGKARDPHQQQRWLVQAVDAYRQAVSGFDDALAPLPLESDGWKGFRAYLRAYRNSKSFEELSRATEGVLGGLAAVRYSLEIRGGRVTVGREHEPDDWTDDVRGLLLRFGRGASREYRLASPNPHPPLNHVESRILDLVAQLFPEAFDPLAAFFTTYGQGFLDDILWRVYRELAWCLAVWEAIDQVRAAGLPLCFPELDSQRRGMTIVEGFDWMLAVRRIREGRSVVVNDLEVGPDEHTVVITGPNQGGKTTFARMVGQVHYLASLGCPVPARQARVPLCDQVWTHFEQAERVETQRGKLQDELLRLRAVLREATSNSLVVLNEVFQSTTLDDAQRLSHAVMAMLEKLGVTTICVTFLDGLALRAGTVSLVSLIDPEHLDVRPFKLVRQPPDGLSYAMALARRHRLTRDAIVARVP